MTVPVAFRSLILSLSLWFGGCVTPVAPYDAMIDQGVTNMQVETITFLRKVERAPLGKETYPQYEGFYDRGRATIETLRARADIVGFKSDKTPKQLEILKESYASLEEKHKERGLKSFDAKQAEQNLNRIFRAILTLEVAKKDLDAP